jgi:multiple antibiotic resistance protein
MAIFDFAGLFSAIVTLFVILDPFLSLGVFSILMRKAKPHDFRKAAFTASSVAFTLLFIFLVFGNYLFDLLGIDFASFKIAGGIILLIMGIQQVLGLEFHKEHKSFQSAAIVIGTPLLAGPGSISSVLIMQKYHGFLIPFIAMLVVCAVTYVMLAYSNRLYKFLGAQMLEISSRILGLLLAAIAVSFIRDGIVMMIKI